MEGIRHDQVDFPLRGSSRSTRATSPQVRSLSALYANRRPVQSRRAVDARAQSRRLCFAARRASLWFELLGGYSARRTRLDSIYRVEARVYILELVEEARVSWEEHWTAWSRAHSDLALENAANAGETLVREDAPRRGDARAAALEQLELPIALELGVTARERHRELLEELMDERGSWRL